MAIRVPLPAHDAGDNAEGLGHEQTGRVAFEDLWQHRAALRDICQRIVGDAATADDVVQETYLRALSNLDRLEERPSLMPWLATVARRRSIDELRRRQYQRPVAATPDESTRSEHDPGEAAGISETVARVRQALTALTDRERDLLIQQVNQGLSLAELASLDNSSVNSVRSVLSRARTKLRDALTDAGTRVLAPVGLLGAWAKRKVGEVNARVQRVSPMVPGGYERVGEMATAAAAAAALVVASVLPVVLGGDSGRDGSIQALAGADAASRTHGSGAGDDGGTASPLGLDAATRGGRSGGTGAAGGSGSGTDSGGLAGGIAAPGGVGPEIPVAPPPPSEPGSPLPAREDPPEDPDGALIDDITYPGEGFTAAGGTSGRATLFALGHFAGECPDGGCDVLYKSDNGGKSWTKLSATGLDADMIMVGPGWPTDDRIFAMGPSGLQVSVDGGQAFGAPLNGAYKGPAAMSPGFAHGDESIFIGGAPYWDYDADGVVARPGAVSGLSGDIAHFAFSPDYATSGLLLAGSTETSPNGLLKPAVWTCQSGACRSPQYLEEIFSAPSVFVTSTYDTDHVSLAWRDSYLYVSRGQVLDFSLVTSLPINGSIRAVTDDGAGAIYVAIDAAEAGKPAGIVKSSDGARTWTLLGSGTALANSTATVTAVPGGAVFAAPRGTAGRGIYCSTDGGTTWNRRCKG